MPFLVLFNIIFYLLFLCIPGSNVYFVFYIKLGNYKCTKVILFDFRKKNLGRKGKIQSMGIFGGFLFFLGTSH